VEEEAFDDLDLSLNRHEEEDPPQHDRDDDTDFDPTDEIQRALYMTTLPLETAAKRWGLPEFLLKNLQNDGYQHFFPIQALVIPDVIISETYMQSLQVRDVCCTAPTGSGKTLAFVLPILQALAKYTSRRLRALVVLPSRDLAQQVHQVFQKYAQGSALKIGLAMGQTDFAQEQQALILGDDDNDFDYPCLPYLKHLMNPGNLQLQLEVMANDILDEGDTNVNKRLPAGGISAVDVLVCTPGRLVDHLDNTPAFTLQHLQFLVLDEADRLLSQSYHGWIRRVLDSVHGGGGGGGDQASREQIDDESMKSGAFWKNVDPVTCRRREPTRNDTGHAGSSSVVHRMQLRKLLYSATFTRDPQKLAALQLTHPKFFNAHHLRQQQQKQQQSSLYRMPSGLQEQIVECTAEQKPLVLLALLLERLQQKVDEKEIVLVFTSSVESTHRLTRLLQLLWQSTRIVTTPPPREFSSTLSQKQRSELLERCSDPDDRSVFVLVCSDGMSRGMDLSSVRTVIHYDVPSMSKTYVHRCGRTARAEQEGRAVSLLKGKGQLGQFQKMRKLIAEPERVTKAVVKTSLVRGVLPSYKQCVSSLKQVLSAEKKQELKPLDLDLSRWVAGCDNNDRDDSSSDSDGSMQSSHES
jgi:ATP-dependent RNA helicase DDX51/DBP6